MSIAKSKWRFDLVLPLSLLSLLLVLAWLQYRWTGALSRAEAARLRSGLSSSLTRFGGEFDFEIARVLRAFSMRSPSELPEALAEFRHQAHYPEIVSELYRLGFEEGRFELAKLEEDGTFVRTGPPTGLERLAARAEALRHPHRGRPRPPGPPLALVSSDPVSIVVPARWEPGDPREPAATMVVFRNDVIAERLLPDIAERLFGSDDSPDFDVAVVDDADRVVFSSRDNAFEVIRSADASSSLLSLRSAVGGPRPRRDRGPGPDGPPPPPQDLRRDDGPWRVYVRHRAGSVDAVVETARVRNLALGSGVLFLLGLSIVLVTVSARRTTELSERKMEFVAGVSHELRTPLAVIRSAAQNLADGSVSGGPQVRRYGGLIEAEGRRLEDLVEKVLELAGVQSQNQHSPRERISIAGIARSAIADSATEARESGIDVEADLPAADLFVLGDGDALRRGVANLVGNAIKHGGEKNSVTVSVEPLSGEVSISVSDRGPGIPPSEVPHLFEAFYRGRRAREQQVRGSGLGLSLVQQIAREHGGRVEVDTNPGKGSRFSLILPMARSPEGSVE
jgi:signal transduction histidine kinase